MLAFFFNRFLALIAYGPWGPLHQVFIFVFRKIYGIEDNTKAKTLGNFFLRPTPLTISSTSLVSPAEGLLVEGPTKINFPDQFSTTIKGIRYKWNDLVELSDEPFKYSTAWNIYLAPYNYHWVHACADGSRLEAQRKSGGLYPVNVIGRWLRADLYTVNERLTFRWTHPEWGRVVLACVGALGVSGLQSTKGAVPYDHWGQLSDTVIKGEPLLAFRLGSSVLMMTEKSPDPSTFSTNDKMLTVGRGLT